MSSTGKKIITSEEEAKARMAEKRREMKVGEIDEDIHYLDIQITFDV